jgi:AcrR family transcriptional regulator
VSDAAAEGRRTATEARRRKREAEIVAATRALFDERGMRDAQVEDIARAAGVNRAILYRHFTGKEEIFALVVASYLGELRDRLSDAVDGHDDARTRLTALVDAFVDYGVAHPAFADCAQALMRLRGPELLAAVSESALGRLGRAVASCLAVLSETLERGVATGDFAIEDPQLLANAFYASGLGALQLARVGILVTESAPGVPGVGTISPEQVRDYLVASALAMAAGPPDRAA